MNSKTDNNIIDESNKFSVATKDLSFAEKAKEARVNNFKGKLWKVVTKRSWEQKFTLNPIFRRLVKNSGTYLILKAARILLTV